MCQAPDIQLWSWVNFSLIQKKLNDNAMEEELQINGEWRHWMKIPWRKHSEQDSPPAWTQEAYCPPRSKCTLCSTGQDGGYPTLTWLGGGYPILGLEYPSPEGTRDQSLGYPPGKDMGPVQVLWDVDGVPPGKDMGPVQVLWDGDGVNPPPPRCGWTNTCENITFPHRVVINSGWPLNEKKHFQQMVGDMFFTNFYFN